MSNFKQWPILLFLLFPFEIQAHPPTLKEKKQLVTESALGNYDPEKLQNEILKKFLYFANSPASYVYEMIYQYKQKHQNELNPEGGIETPITAENVQVQSNFREDINKAFCNENKVCTTRSTKQELLISIPLKIIEDGIIRFDKINFTMKGGFKTMCLDKHCEDSSIYYLPEDIDFVPRMHLKK